MNIKLVAIILGVILGIYLLITYIRSRTGFHEAMFDDPVDAREQLKVDNKNYKYMSEKEIFNKGGLKCLLTPRNNNLVVEMPLYASNNTERITFNNVPLQKWLNITIILDNRFLDLWINGELYHSRHLPNLPLIQEKQPLLICSKRGFDGFVSRFYYWDYPLSKNLILFIFDGGPIDKSIFGKMLKKWNKLKGSVNISVDVDVTVGDKSPDAEDE